LHSMTEQTRSGYTMLGFARLWPVVLFLGIVTVGFGVVVLVWPEETLKVISILIGLQLLLFGLFRLIGAFSDAISAPGLTGFVGVLLMIAGIIVLRHPFETAALLATILGVVWIVTGAVDSIDAIANGDSKNRLLQVLAGLVTIAAGAVVVSWPAPTVEVIAWITGFYLVVHGLFIAANAMSLRYLAEG
jgi:uncharacterized membrane protein HdeD (DUF308 family)